MQTGPTKLETVLGGTEIIITKSDGTTEPVCVLQLPIRKYTVYLMALEDEAAMVELLTGKPKGWNEELTTESFERIVVEGERINADFFGRWLQRRLDRQEKLMPGMREQLAVEALKSQISSLNSPSSAA
jgi:hypothetical protein